MEQQNSCRRSSSVIVQGNSSETSKRTVMKPEGREPVWLVSGGLVLCVAVVASGVFDGVCTDVGYEYYAEPTVPGLPAVLAMPANCLINLAYIVLGWYWLPSGDKKGQTHYLQEVFALMALVYGPVQWVRLWTQHHWAAVLDQWLTLPIFAWGAVWCHFLEQGWQPGTFLAMEATSLASYALALLHPQGFEMALSGHIFIVVWRVLKVQRRLGNAMSAWIMALGMVSFLGFVSLKLWDLELAQWAPFHQFTGHFWSKICDVLQFHCAFLFFIRLSRCHLKSQ
ncbi:transmembrane protein 187 isoform X2 [Rhineura floridana]|nr:transmembrane protein 187 isoform X2 [Rhineura floridana]XP_061469916.1 transmembrane protein 187 isoform X2 [Rhineura floridana]XP_061469917.1 transmembrane protein 187 isoform X2 [Rhineura floridana]XP_061469918.1 transmembrane protein 187 isoform X2 [Rhineura floridana]XP_061469920.1 transmembrane protein 187 isoform X2 [Rhineura floridana]XP_061469921.1 transmembrane protein 187 isoform X2 [Rhineura floridana]XP_061469922.1 transmembrane protein 187 isoform X2 [Rhineura floridana]XP_0